MRPNWMLWNQRGTDTGSSLFGRMAASYIPLGNWPMMSPASFSSG